MHYLCITFAGCPCERCHPPPESGNPRRVKDPPPESDRQGEQTPESERGLLEPASLGGGREGSLPPQLLAPMGQGTPSLGTPRDAGCSPSLGGREASPPRP
jgi:hypothetical protein